MSGHLIWLVTGCSSGIGEELVQSILKRGDRVIATARGKVERLQALKDLGADTLELDVTADQTAFDQIAQDAVNIYGGLDVLVNNAGYVEACLMEDARWVQTPETELL